MNSFNFRTAAAVSILCGSIMVLAAVFLFNSGAEFAAGAVLGVAAVNINLPLLRIAVKLYLEHRAVFPALSFFTVRLIVYGLTFFAAYKIGGNALPGLGLGALMIVPGLLIAHLRK